MLVYLDESYDQPNQNWLILGALFNPHHRFLHRRIAEIKEKADYRCAPAGRPRELKYNRCITRNDFQVAQEALAVFWESTSWFRAIAVETGAAWFDWDKFGRLPEESSMRKAIAYKRFTELLLEHNSRNVVGATLLMDERSKVSRDRFVELIKDSFGTAGKAYSRGLAEPRYRQILEYQSHLERYNVGQVCDLLMGSVLNANVPTKNKWKTQLRSFVESRCGLPNLLRESWGKYSKSALEELFPKFNIWYWSPS